MMGKFACCHLFLFLLTSPVKVYVKNTPYIQAYTISNSMQLLLSSVKGMSNEILIGLFMEPFQMSNHILSPKWCHQVVFFFFKLEAISYHPPCLLTVKTFLM